MSINMCKMRKGFYNFSNFSKKYYPYLHYLLYLSDNVKRTISEIFQEYIKFGQGN